MSYDPLGIEEPEEDTVYSEDSDYDPLNLYKTSDTIEEHVPAEEKREQYKYIEDARQLADAALIPITMPISWAASGISGIIAKSLTDDEDFANQIREDVAKRTTWEPRSELGKAVMGGVEPGFRDLSKTLRQMTGSARMLPGVSTNPEEPLFGGKLYENSPIEDIAQFGAEAWAFKKAGKAGEAIKGEIPSRPIIPVEKIPERPIERNFGRTVEAPEEMIRQRERAALPKEEYDPLGIEKEVASVEPTKPAEILTEKPVAETLPEVKAETGAKEIVEPEPILESTKMERVAPETAKETIQTEGVETGIKNAVTLVEREARGMSEVEVETRRTFGSAFEEGKRLVESGERNPRVLAQEMVDNPRALNAEESVMLIYDRMKLQSEHRSTMAEVEKAIGDGNITLEKTAREKLLKIEEEISVNDTAARRTGYEQGLGLAARRMMIKEDYSLANMLQKARIDNDGKPIPPEIRTKYERISKRIEEATDNLKAHEENLSQLESVKAVEKIKREVAKEQRQTKRTYAKEELAVEFDSLVKELNSKLNQLNAGIDPTAALILGKMAKNRVKSGVITVEGIVDEIYTTVKSMGLELDKRTIRDAISGYGKTSQMSQDAINVQMRELKGQMRLISAFEDATAGQVPLRSGLQRDKPSDTVRELGRKVKQVMRENGVDFEKTRTAEEQWKTALDAVKTRLNNKIADVTKQIETGTREQKPKGIVYDAEATALKEKADMLVKLRNAIEEPSAELAIEKPGEIPVKKKREMSTEQKVNAAIRAAERTAGEYARRVNEGDLSPKKKPSTTPETPELKTARGIAEDWKQFVEELKAEANPKRTPEEIALQSLKTRTTKRIAELEGKLATGDFSKKPKKVTELDPEGLTLKFNLDKALRSYHEARIKDQMARRNVLQKIGGTAAEVANLTRAIKTSFDLSAVLRQGGFIAFGHPLRAAKSIPAMFKALRSEKGQFAVNQEILHRPNYPLYERSKLYLSEHGQKLSQMEEVYMSRWAEKIPGVAASQRAYTTFLNKLRADSFDAMVKTLSAKEKPTTQELGVISNFINVATGRGNMGAKENALVGLNTVFFAPRYVASRFQLLAGQPLWKGTAGTRTMVAKEYARFLAGIGVVYTLAKAAGAEIEIDPRSSDFGKIKMGNTRLDPLLGLSQTTVLMSRLLSGETKTASGDIIPIRGEGVPYGGADSADIMARFLRTKLAPVPSMGTDILAGKDVVSQEVTPGSMPERLLAPLAFNDIYQTMKEQGVPSGAALGILSLFGMGLQTYDTENKNPDTIFDTINQDFLGHPSTNVVRGVRAARRQSRYR